MNKLAIQVANSGYPLSTPWKVPMIILALVVQRQAMMMAWLNYSMIWLLVPISKMQAKLPAILLLTDRMPPAIISTVQHMSAPAGADVKSLALLHDSE